ncbi:hypothetical protein [Streptomyces sp. WAC06614]|uniref:hypothetical protein n=1 Tax=Streptomyces sp. WAC06614 TaxID=2487416 RepID=UPI000F79476F|nr:hypothetical protein [Streptomyces sp. WAC06614]RSS79036.1 hypothetical protein EF918_18770 [Streptomyces sp. WAC06614]
MEKDTVDECDGQERFRRWVLDVLRLLSSPPSVQLEFLKSVRVGADELLLQFDDLIRAAHGRLVFDSMNEEEYGQLQHVETFVNSVNEAGAYIWSDDALCSSAEWANLRAAAGETRQQLADRWELWQYL